MNTIIQNRLSEIEADFNVKILYAVESGSRAWGFESTDSDYDVRFIYIHPPKWYLSIEKKRDVIEIPIVDELDISGWEIRKALKLFRNSNPTLLEWMRSPIVYKQFSCFIDELREIELDYFSPKGGIYNYLNSAKRNTNRYLKNDEVFIKKYFYSLRTLLCCFWIEKNRTPPPMEFSTLLEAYDGSPEFREEIQALLDRKLKDEELDLEPKNPVLDEFINSLTTKYESFVASMAEFEKPPIEALDTLFQEMLKEVWA